MKSLNAEGSAPSNIALIKYMGKKAQGQNWPTNASFSYSLEHLRTFVTIQGQENLSADVWQPLDNLELSLKGQKRFLDHFQFLKNHFGIQKNFLVKSGNSFPSDCGLASSASSFAALTMTACQLFEKINPKVKLSVNEVAELSRKGSGSSCRSLMGPWVLWSENQVSVIETSYPKMHHLAIVVESEKKIVSSSEAHLRVSSSYLFEGRPERAEKRLVDLLKAFQSQDWGQAYEVCWAEFWDMHALFETAIPHFSYMTPESLVVLRKIEKQWQIDQDGPLVTMDAGPNVHLLFKDTQRNLFEKYQQMFFGSQCIKSV